MFVYQAAIMLAVIAIVLVMVYLFRVRKPGILAVTILVLVIAGGLSLALIQGYFGNNYYSQKLDVSTYKSLILTDSQKSSLAKIFRDYENKAVSQEQCTTALERTYSFTQGKARSSVTVDLMLFKNKSGADEFFKLSQVFYENKNKNFVQEDPKLSKKAVFDSFRYITSYMRSDYSDVNDIIYVPSKIYYTSEVIIQNGEFVATMTEKSNKPVTFKNEALSKIKSQLASYGAAPAK